LKVISRLTELDDTAEGLPASFQKINEIFGGTRGALPVQALLALEKEQGKLSKNLDRVTGSAQKQREQIDLLNRRYKDATASTSGLADQNANLVKILGMTFINAAFGSEDLQGTLKIINDMLKDMAGNAKLAGEVFRTYFTAGMFIPFDNAIRDANKNLSTQEKLLKSIRGELSKDENFALIKQLENRDVQRGIIKTRGGKDIGEYDGQRPFDAPTAALQARLKQEIDEAKQRAAEQVRIELRLKLSRESGEEVIQEVAVVAEEVKKKDVPLSLSFQYDLEKMKADNKKAIDQIFDVGDSVIAFEELNRVVSHYVDLFNKDEDSKKAGIELLDKQRILTLALEGNAQEILNLTTGQVVAEKEVAEILSKALSYSQEIEKLKKAELDRQEDMMVSRLQALGANELQVAQAKVNFLITERKLQTDNLKVIEAQHNVEKARLKTIEEQTRKVGGVFSSAIREGLEEGDFTTFTDRLRNGIRSAFLDSVSEGLTNQLMNFTGLDAIMGQDLASIKMTEAFQTGGTFAANQMRDAMTQGGQAAGQSISSSMSAGAGGTVGGAGAAGGKGFLGGFGKFLGVGLMAASLFQGSRGSSGMSQRFSTAPGGKSIGDATTRSTTTARVTNLTLQANVYVNGELSKDSTLNNISIELVKQLEEKVLRKLDEENITLGNA